jgi:GAF domain-containing protein
MTRTEGFDVAKAFAQVARDIADHDDLLGTRDHIVRLAHSSLGTSGAAMWHLKDPTAMALDACTDPVFMDLMRDILADSPDGPAWAALKDQQVHVSLDLTVETRWPYYVSRLLAESPVRSIMGYPLTVGKHELGVLALYSDRVGHFTEQIQDMAGVFAAHASLALEKAFMAERNDNLEAALASNRRIGMAIGILMASLKVTDEQAFDLLRITSQHIHRKLRDVAEEVIMTGTVPQWRGSVRRT